MRLQHNRDGNKESPLQMSKQGAQGKGEEP